MEVARLTLGRVENSKTFQNQMAQCFFIGFYDIETGVICIFSKKNFLIGGNGFQKNQFLQEKNGQNQPENHQNWSLAKIAPKSDKSMK